MKNKQLLKDFSNEWLEAKIDNEGGTDYFFRFYGCPDIADKKLQELVNEAVNAMNKLDRYLEKCGIGGYSS